MKYLLKSFFVAASIMQLDLLIAQGPVNTNPANPNAAGATSAQFWSRQGNTSANGTNNVFGTQAGFNSQVWFATNGIYRMMMDDGSNAILDGRISMGNNLPGNFQPVDRLHLHQTGGTTAMRYSTNGTGS